MYVKEVTVENQVGLHALFSLFSFLFFQSLRIVL